MGPRKTYAAGPDTATSSDCSGRTPSSELNSDHRSRPLPLLIQVSSEEMCRLQVVHFQAE